MADKTIGELPIAQELNNDSLLVVEQQNEARSIKGKLVADFAREAGAADVQRAVAAAKDAAQSKTAAAKSAEDAKAHSTAAGEAAQTAASEAAAAKSSAGSASIAAARAEAAAGKLEEVAVGAVVTQSELKASGVNLYTGTKDFSGSAWKNISVWTKGSEKYDGLTVISKAERWGGVYQELTANAGDVYTFSFYGKADTSQKAAITVMSVAGDHAKISRSVDITMTAEWERYSGTVQVTAADGPLKLKVEKIDDTQTKIYICGIKVERGSIATGWTPAPEDLPEVTSGTAAPKELANGQIFLVYETPAGVMKVDEEQDDTETVPAAEAG